MSRIFSMVLAFCAGVPMQSGGVASVAMIITNILVLRTVVVSTPAKIAERNRGATAAGVKLHRESFHDSAVATRAEHRGFERYFVVCRRCLGAEQGKPSM